MVKKRATRYKKHKRNRRRTQRGGSAAVVGLLDNADGVPLATPPPPDVNMIVKFGPTSSKTASDFGNTIKIEESQPQPHVHWKEPPAGTLYTLLCWDPDAQAKSWLHWLVVNCKDTTPEDGTTLQEWSPPSPPKGSGLHRYIFALFKQTGALTIGAPTQAGFHVQNFATQNGLTPLAYKGMRVNA